MLDSTIRSSFVEAFLAEGDDLRRGGVVGYRQAGVRLVGDIELTGSTEDLANFGQALVDRFRPNRWALVIGNLVAGFTSYGPTAPGEEAAEAMTVGLHDGDWEFVPLERLVAAPAQTARDGELAELLDQFRTAVAYAESLEDEAQRLCDEANDKGLENDEFAKRDQADYARWQALRLAVQIVDGYLGGRAKSEPVKPGPHLP